VVAVVLVLEMAEHILEVLEVLEVVLREHQLERLQTQRPILEAVVAVAVQIHQLRLAVMGHQVL
jgi:hypothetical protein